MYIPRLSWCITAFYGTASIHMYTVFVVYFFSQNKRTVLAGPHKSDLHVHVPYRTYTLWVFNFANFANLELFAKLIRLKFEPLRCHVHAQVHMILRSMCACWIDYIGSITYDHARDRGRRAV